jgi:Tfp pilus assembly protein PilZ
VFDSEEAFLEEYRTNVANGGIFVATDETYEIREPVYVRIRLRFISEQIDLEGEVVHVVPAEMAAAGGTPGVAIHFNVGGPELRQRFARWASVDPTSDERRRQAGRRRATRTAARVSAELADEDRVRLRGRTRNLSASGVLIACEGEPVPLETRVGLTLTHPISGERRSVAGRVVRHVIGPNGTVTGVAVEFEVRPAERDEFARFIADVKSGDHSQRLGGIRGDIAEVGVEGVVQMLARSAPRGTLTLTRGSEEGIIALYDGRVCSVRLGSHSGTKALSELLGWQSGEFEFHSRVDAEAERAAGEEAMPIEAALLEAARWSDEAGRERPGAADQAIDDELVEEILAEAGSDFDPDPLDPAATLEWRGGPDVVLTELEESLRDLALVGMTVGKAISVIPESAGEVRTVLASLVRRGLVGLS